MQKLGDAGAGVVGVDELQPGEARRNAAKPSKKAIKKSRAAGVHGNRAWRNATEVIGHYRD